MMAQLPDMYRSTGGAVLRKRAVQYNRNVILLKNCDFRRIDGHVCMPTDSEISTLRKTQPGQFRKKVEFSASMSEDAAKKKLQETFPYLENTSFVCAAVVKVDKEHKKLEFYGPPRVWNGKTIRKTITGNSALYILENEVPDSVTELNATKMPLGDDDVASNIAVNVNQMSLRDEMENNENHQESSSDESATVQQISYSSGEGTSSIDGASTSGIGAEFSEEDLSLLQWAEENVHYQVSVNPDKSPLEGGAPCSFRFNPKLQPDVTSGRATFGNLAAVELERSTNGSLFGNSIPASPKPGWVPIIVESQDGKILGQTEIYYKDPVEDTLQQLLFDPSLQKRLFDKYDTFMRLGGNLQTSSAEVHQSETLGLKQPVEMLGLLVCAAAERGAQQFLDMIFTSSAGRIIFEAYKDGSTLPEVIAKDHGNELTVHYLQSVTNRFSKDIKTGKECSQTIDWSELVKAAEEAQNRLDVISKELNYQIERDLPKETGYLGDDETSSSESSELHHSDSEDDISRTSWKETQAKVEEWKKPDLENGNHANGANEISLTQSPILFLKDGEIHSERANVKTFHFHETKPHKWKEDGLLIQSIYIQEAHNLRQLKSLHRSGNSFFLDLSNEPVNHNLITSYQRLIHLLKLTKERNARCKMQVDTAEARQSSENLSAILGNKDDHNTDIVDLLQQLYCRLVTKDYTATANNVDLTAGKKSAKWLMEHCQSAAFNFWVLTYAFTPTREILFFYVADNKDVLLLTSCTDDKEYELSWHRCRNNVPKVQETDSSQTGGPTYHYNYITNMSGSCYTAVGPGAQANNFHQSKARGDVHVHGDSSNIRQGTSRAKEQQEPTYNGTYTDYRAKLGRKSFLSENNSATYCLHNINAVCCQPHFGPNWNPKPSKEILGQQGATDAKSSIELFLEDVEKSVAEFDNADGPLKEEKEQFILLQILPYLEMSWGKSASKKMDAYRILAKISSSRSSGEVVKQALLQLQHLLFRDNLESCKENLLKVEKIIRSSINSPDAVFKEEEDSVRETRLSVYQRILFLIIVHQIQAGFCTVDFKNDLKKLQEELRICCNQITYKRKNIFRYSMEFIQEAISYLLKPNNKVADSNLSGCFDQCQDLLDKQDCDVMDLKFLRKLKKSRAFVKKMKAGEWFDLHCIMCYLHGKVHSERPKHQMRSERRAMILLRRILEAYQENGGGDDWRFCLLAASILSDVATNNVTRELRIEAASCLMNLLKDKKLQRRPECRVILERMSSGVLFSPDPFTKILFANHLFENYSLPDALPEELHIQHLKTRYRNQTLEVNKTTISQGQRCYVKRGMFQKKEVAVKIVYVTKQGILDGESQDQSETRDRLVREAYNLSRLSVQKHPHITVLLAYNTKSFPYHIITEFERYGNLLQFFQTSREGNELLPTALLLKMLLEVIEALLLLEKQGLVHRDVRAENILVGDMYVCKLTGMHSLRQLQTESIAEGQDQDSLYDYCSADDSCLEVISPGDENLPVRWKAPECLLEHRYSTASDVWAFGVLMYEVLTQGCPPYRNIPFDDEVINRVVYKKDVLPRESCFDNGEYETMKQCWEWQRRRRTTFADLKKQLGKLHDHAANSEEIPRDDPPPLELPISHTSYFRSDNCADDLPTTYLGQDGPLVKERITGANKQHLKNLLTLRNNTNLVRICQIENLESHCPVVEMISSDAPLGNLKEYVLDRRCQKGDIAMFLSQVSSALHYLHENHVVHGDLRAEYVNVLAPNKIQVARLGRSKSLPKSADEVTSTSCVIQSSMPPDSTRWSSPEVILENNYSHASDVWAFGILAWELYTAFATGQERKGFSIPYCGLDIDEILPHVRDKGPLAKPEGCPDWVYIIMHQCWTYDPVQRPPFIAIFECLTCRQPMKSWMMSLWLKNHEKSEWPDLSISQPEDACHVSIRDKNHFERAIEEMCSEGFFTVHGYKYVQWDDAKAERVDDCMMYDDVDWKDSTQSASDLQAEELYEYVPPAYQLRSGCGLRSPQELPDLNAFSVDPRYKNVRVDVTKTDLQEEEAYDDVRSIEGVVSTEARVTNTAVDMVNEVLGHDETYDDISDEIYEEIGNQPPALCHSAGTDEHSKVFCPESKNLYTAEEVERKTSDLEDEDLYEEIQGPFISNTVKACGSKSPQSSDFTTNAENGSVAGKGKEEIHDDPLYAEIGSLQLADMDQNRGCQSTAGNPDTTGYRELLPREYMSLQREQASTFNPKDTSPSKKDVAKLNNRRRHCNSK